MNEINLYEIPISLMRQYYFCPRIIYFTEVMGIKPFEPVWVRMGSENHNKQEKLFHRRVIGRFGIEEAEYLYNVRLFSPAYGINGICDLVLSGDTFVYPVEIKTGKIHKGHFAQIAGYAVCLEEKYGKKADKGFISQGSKGKVTCINIDLDMKNLLKECLKAIREIIDSQVMPDSSASIHQCGQCEFLNFCNDRNF